MPNHRYQQVVSWAFNGEKGGMEMLTFCNSQCRIMQQSAADIDATSSDTQ